MEKEIEVTIKFPEVEPLNPPVLQLNEVQFKYSNDKVIFNLVNLSANLDSRICIVSYFAPHSSIRYNLIQNFSGRRERCR